MTTAKQMSRTTGMYQRLAWLLLLLAAIGTAHAGPKIETWQTPNGMQVLYVEAREIPMIDLRITFAAGGSRDGGVAGLASLTSSMLPQGAGGMDAGEIARSYERIGAGMGNGSLRDMAWLSLRSLSDQEYIRPALDTFSKVLWNPDFPEKDFARVKKQYLTGLKAQEARPGVIASKRFYRELYGEHPYASPVSGTVESVTGITLDQIRAFHKRYYVAANAVMAIVGDLDKGTAEKLAETLSHGLAKGEAAAPLPPLEALKPSQQLKVEFPSKQAHVMMGMPAIERGHPDYFPLYLGNYVLGGGGLNSELSKKVREEKGYAYSIGSGFQLMEGPGPFLISLQTRGDQADDALELINQTLDHYLQSGPDDERLASARKSITGSFPLKIATNSNILQYLTVLGFYNMPLDYLDTYNTNIEAVDKKSIIEAFRRHVDKEKMITVVVGGEA